MANQRGIVAGWDATNSRPKGVTSAADMRASLQMIATHPGIMTEPGAATITLPSNAMRINWTAFTAVIRSTLGGWYTPRIDAGGIALSIGNATYARIDVVWVRQRDYQTNASWPDSEVEVGVAQGTASATPSTPAVPTGALAVFTVRVPAGATTGSAIGLANVTAAARTAPAGGIITAASQAEMDAIAAAAGADNGLYVWRSDAQALMRHDGTAWELVTPRDTGWVLIWSSGATYQIKARVIEKTLWVSAAVNDVSGGWTCTNKLPVEMRPQWAESYVYVLITEGSGANNIAKMGVRADGSLWFRSYGSSTNIDGLTSVPL